ncbi:MAG TPA: exonuclease domain-containing protein [Bacteroidia bacterium]|nr:exonuclease domain-containing protein [Bacteroidia bacterium]
MIENIAVGIDFETTGLDENSQIIEYALVRYCTKTSKIITCLSNLVNPCIEIPQEAQELTGITQDIVESYAISLETATTHISSFLSKATYLIAHNAEFELSYLNKLNIDLSHLQIVDTMKDIDYPSNMKHRDLDRLALYHKCPNFAAHRALPDTLAMMNILAQYNFSDVLAYKAISNIKIISLAGFDKKDLVKSLGFSWDATLKYWYMDCKENKAENVFELLLTNNIKYQIYTKE